MRPLSAAGVPGRLGEPLLKSMSSFQISWEVSLMTSRLSVKSDAVAVAVAKVGGGLSGLTSVWLTSSHGTTKHELRFPAKSRILTSVSSRVGNCWSGIAGTARSVDLQVGKTVMSSNLH